MPTMYRLDSTGRRWADRAAQLVQTTISANAAEVDQQAAFPSEGLRMLGEQGFWGLCLPADVGGQGQPPTVLAAVVEQLASGCGSTAMVYVMHVAASQAVVASETLAERRTLLEQMAAGRHLTTLAFSERGSRSQFWAPVSQLQPNGQGYTTSAQKSWVTSARHADSYVCSALQPQSQSPLDSTLYLMRRGAAGVRVDGQFLGLGLRGNDSAPLLLQEAVVAEDDLLTHHGHGAPMMLEVVLPWFIVGTAAMANGLCRAAIERTTAHLTSNGFQHTGSLLRDLPNLRSRLAQMQVRTEQSRSLLAVAAEAMTQPDQQTLLYLLQARLASVEAAMEVTDLAMKACGGAAFSRHLEVERFFRDARAGWVMAPTVDHLQEFIGRALSGLPLF